MLSYKMKFIVILTICATIPQIDGARKNYDGYKLYRLSLKNQDQIEQMRIVQNINPTIVFHDQIIKNAEHFRVIVPPSELLYFDKVLSDNQINYEIISDNIKKLLRVERDLNDANRKISQRDFTHFWKWDEISSYLDQIASDHNDIATIEVIGKTFEGRDIRAVKISLNRGIIRDTKPIVLIDSAMHSGEWIAPMVALKLIHELVEHTEKYKHVLNNLDWIIVPVLNIDGYIYTHEVDRFWRKTRSINANTTCIGVDINRNFDYKWDALNEDFRLDPCNIRYRGSKPATETEVQAMTALIRRYKSTKMYLSLHSYGQLFLYPWTYESIKIENYLLHEEVAKLAIEAIRSVNGTEYVAGTSYDLLYFSSGVSKDYAAGPAQIELSFTIELPGGGVEGFDLEPYRISSVVNETLPGLIELGKFVAQRWKN